MLARSITGRAVGLTKIWEARKLMRLVCLIGRPPGLFFLRSLLKQKDDFKIVKLFTHRYLPLSESPVRRDRVEYADYVEVAKQEGIPLIALDTRKESVQLGSHLQDTEFDLLLSLSWRFKVLPDVLNMAKILPINLHRGRLPQYKGGEPVKRAIMNGDHEVAITAHVMINEIDAGEILSTKTIPVSVNLGESITEAAERIKNEIIPFYPDVFNSVIEDIKRNRRHAKK